VAEGDGDSIKIDKKIGLAKTKPEGWEDRLRATKIRNITNRLKRNVS